MQKYVRKLEIIGIYERFDIIQEFQKSVNIIYGINGVGKTTLIHILANLFNGDYRRFLDINFARITAWLNNDNYIEIIREDKDSIKVKQNGERWGKNISRNYINFNNLEIAGQVTGEELLLPVAYFPSFRTMIDAWASVEEEQIVKDNLKREIPHTEFLQLTKTLQLRATGFARKIFGQFIPYLNYPSVLEIEQELSEKVRTAIISIAQLDREVLSQSFIDIFAALSLNDFNTNSETASEILEEIKILSKNIHNYPFKEESMSPTGVYSQLSTIINSMESYDTDSRQIIAVLSVYRNSLKQIFNTLEKSFSGIKSYLSAVNYFLQGKQIIYAENLNSINSLIQIRFEDNSLYNGLSALSSGERQIVTLIYAATNMSQQQLVLIDEPEISLHIDWQRELLQKMSEQLSNHQIIACTHSPTIGADYEDCLQELNLKATNKNNWYKDNYEGNSSEYLEDNNTGHELDNLDINITDEDLGD